MKITGIIRSGLAPLALLCVLSTGAAADVVELRSGEIVEGRYLGGTQTSVRFEVGGETRVIQIADILALTFDTRQQQAATSAPAQAAPPPPPPAEPAQATPEAIVVPAGTAVHVRMQSAIDSNRHGNGHRFTAVLEGNLSAGGQVVAKRGSTVYGQVVSAKRSRRVAGKSEMHITLTGISIKGDIVPIQTSGARAVTANTAGKTASQVGRGAAIGALANGSRGAKNGAKVGAGAAVLTGGNSIHIPAGTLVDFSLTGAVDPLAWLRARRSCSESCSPASRSRRIARPR